MSSSPGVEPLRPRAPRVVIADDDAAFRSGVRAALQDAGIVVIAEALRMLSRGPLYQVIDLSLRSPQHREIVKNEAPGPYVNPGYVFAASEPTT